MLHVAYDINSSPRLPYGKKADAQAVSSCPQAASLFKGYIWVRIRVANERAYSSTTRSAIRLDPGSQLKQELSEDSSVSRSRPSSQVGREAGQLHPTAGDGPAAC
jgi:hypothetical protein